MKHLTAAFGDLKQAQSKFMACMESLDAIKPANKGEPPRLFARSRSVVAGGCSPYTRLHRLVFAADKRVLIPLTSSLYVPGRIKDTENVLVDIGTGYFVEKVGCSPQSPYD